MGVYYTLTAAALRQLLPVKQALTTGHHMATNLFTKTFVAYHQHSSLPDPPEFLICEQDDVRANAFLDNLRETAGSELRSRVQRVSSGKEWVVSSCPAFPPLSH